jgi:hypothetical protein
MISAELHSFNDIEAVFSRAYSLTIPAAASWVAEAAAAAVVWIQTTIFNTSRTTAFSS